MVSRLGRWWEWPPERLRALVRRPELALVAAELLPAA
jgi:hypothetical protein